MSGTKPTRWSERLAVELFRRAAWVALLLAVFDTGLVQWTGRAMLPTAVALAFVLTAAALLSIASVSGIGALAVAALLDRGRRGSIPEGVSRFVRGARDREGIDDGRGAASPTGFAFSGIVVGVFVAYHLSRARMAHIPLSRPGFLALVVAGSLATALALRSSRTARTRRAIAVAAATVSALAWTLYHRPPGDELSLVAPVLVVATGLVSALWIGTERRFGVGTALTLPLVGLAVLGLTYPLRPGVQRPRHRGPAPAAEAASGSGGEARAGDGVAVADGRPNVVLVVLDTVRADHLSLYGYPKPTSPGLERLAASSTVFETAIANGSWSLPSHASLLTGLLPHQHGAHTVIVGVAAGGEGAGPAGGRVGGGNAGSAEAGSTGEYALAQRPLDRAIDTVAEILAGEGYHCAAIVANHGWISEYYGLDQGFDYLDNRPRTVAATEPLGAPYMRRLGVTGLARTYVYLIRSSSPAETIVDHVLAWRRRVAAEPYFLLVNFMDAHSPYVGGLISVDRFEKSAASATGAATAASSATAASTVVEAYDRSIAYVDDQLGRLLERLDARGDLDHTLLIVTSDHGEVFPEDGHLGYEGHGANLYQAEIRVPLLVRWPAEGSIEGVEDRGEDARGGGGREEKGRKVEGREEEGRKVEGREEEGRKEGSRKEEGREEGSRKEEGREEEDREEDGGGRIRMGRGHRVATPVQLADVFPTILEAVGIAVPPGLAGTSLSRPHEDHPVIAENHFSGIYGRYREEVRVAAAELHRRWPSRWALVDGPWKLVLVSDGQRLLYDLSSDPGERLDLAGRRPELAAAMERRLRSLLPEAAFQPETMVEESLIEDPEALERLRSLGYIR